MNCEENHYNNDHDTPFNRSDEEIGISDDQSNEMLGRSRPDDFS